MTVDTESVPWGKRPLVVTDIAAIVEDALNLLVDAGLIPPGLLPRAADLKAQAHVGRKAPVSP